MGPDSFQQVFPPGQEARRPCRARRCLLKGCEQSFTPCHPQCRYCSSACAAAAARWRRVKASRRYRASADGRLRRREQNRRYRQRRRQRELVGASADGSAAREGQRPAPDEEFFGTRMCDRPGCYVWFTVRHEHSSRRFCSIVCRLALRRVLDREARYRQRRRRWRRERVTWRYRPPDTS